MGKKTKNRKKTKNLIPATSDLEEVLQAQISKLEYQLREIKMQKEAEIAATLETGRKEGYHLGCWESLEAVRKVQVEVAETDTSHHDVVTRPVAVLPSIPVVHAPRKTSILQSGLRDPWGSLSWRHRHSHPRMPSVRVRHHPFRYTTDNHMDVTPIPSPSSIHTVETVQHPYGIGSAKPIIRLGTPIQHMPFIPRSIAQLHHITPSHCILPRFIQAIVSCSLSICSRFFSALFWRRRGCCLVEGGTCTRERRLWAVFGHVWPFP
jgi:hypothetical protein